MNAILMAIDRYYFPHACLCLESIQRYYPDHPEIIVYHNQLTSTQIRKLTSIADVHVVAVCGDASPRVDLMPSHKRMGVNPLIVAARYATWSPTLLHYDSVLYVDADTLVLGSLDYLFEHKEPVMITEPFDTGVFKERDLSLAKSLLSDDGIQMNDSQANSGVFLVPRRFRTEICSNRLNYLNERYRSFVRWQDQGVLNIWLSDQGLKPIDRYEYNYCVNMDLLYPTNFDRANIKLFHFNDMIENELMRLMLMRVGLWCGGREKRIGGFAVLAGRMYRFGKKPGIRRCAHYLSKLRRRFIGR